jgi:pimeloyl-ACP methyl ester carboxylesterase
MPTLVIWGEKDSITPLRRGQELRRLLPNADLVVLPGIGHIPAIEDPESFNAALVAYLSRAQATRSR